MPREALRKWKVISPHVARRRIFSKCALFSTVYNIRASFLDLTNSPVQYSIYVENRRRRSQETARLAFVACRSFFENLHGGSYAIVMELARRAALIIGTHHCTHS